LVTAIVLAACGAGEQTGPESTTTLVPDTSTTTSAAGAEATESTVAQGESEPAPTTTTTTAPTTEEDLMTGPVPEDLMTGIIADLMERTGATQSQLTLVRAESAIWNDGSLGCPLPGQSYTQALVNGYWVVLEYAGSEYDYRASSSSFRLCEGGGSPPSNPTG
jgi:hypothetical protein